MMEREEEIQQNECEYICSVGESKIKVGKMNEKSESEIVGVREE